MPTFKLFFTGDYLDESGAVAGDDPGLEELRSTGYIEPEFLQDQKPAKGDSHYWDRLYSMEITPDHVAKSEWHRGVSPMGKGLGVYTRCRSTLGAGSRGRRSRQN